MNESLRNRRKYEFMLMPLALFSIAWLNYGSFTLVMPLIPNVARWLVCLTWLLFAIFYSPRFLRSLIVLLSPLLIFYMIVFLGYLLAGDGNRLYLNNIAYLIVIYSIFLYYSDERYIKFQRFLVGFLLLDTIVVGVNSYIQLGINPLVARYLSTTADIEQELLNGQSFAAVGNYGYFYALVGLILLPRRK